MPHLGRWIRRNLDDAGVKAVDLARELGVSESLMSRWISGERDPNWTQICKMVEQFGNSPIDGVMVTIDSGLDDVQELLATLNGMKIPDEKKADILLEVLRLLRERGLDGPDE
jgi:transcriptional regulator with XRE-family HTH domain